MPTRARRHPVFGKLTQPLQAIMWQLRYRKLATSLDIVMRAAPERERILQPCTMYNSSSCFSTYCPCSKNWLQKQMAC